MSLKNQKKPPLGPLNPSNNLDEDPPVDKRRKVGLERMAGPTAAGYRARQPLTPVNAGPNAGDQAAAAGSDGGSSVGGVEFSSREDVEQLLNERIRARKNDLKGKSEEAIVLLRKFKSCVRWQIEVEDGCKLELEKLQSLLDSEAKRHSEDETQLKNKIEELNSIIADLHTQYAKLQERLNKEEADKLAMTKSYEEEREAKVAAQKSQIALSEELERTSQEFDRAKAQIKVLQENIRRLELYNRGMEQYNSNIHAEDLKKKEIISKLEEEKNTMAQSLNCQRSKIKSLEELLKSSNDSEQKSIKQKEELKNEVDCLQSELQQVRDDHNHQLRQVQRLEEQLKSSKHSQQEAVEQKEELKEDVCLLRIELEQVRDDRDCQLSKVQSLTAEVASYKELTGKSNKDLENIMTENCELEKVSSSQREQIQMLQHKLAAANEKLKMADLTAIETLADYEDQKKMVKDLQNRVADAEIQIFEGEKLRKKLHNTILELKGNIRVFCRVRPVLSDSDCNISEGPIVSYPTSTEVLGRGIDLMHHEKTYSFSFDKVFNHEASQEDVFDEISPLMQSALDGYKVCIFAYGQTGSGKTYTMMGKPEAAEQKGLIPRSLEEIFQISQSLQSQGWKYKMQASMLEIYNESIRDLLSPGRSGILDATVALHKQYTIKHDSNGNTHVSDLTIIDVCSIKEVSFLLQQAAQSRSVSKTHMNEQSSRSHFVFTLRISGVNENTEQQVQGVLNLIDLAGSERLNKSGSTGDRLKETQAINKSLSALSDVIFAIAKKDDHVPFRNSKLTYLLQPCLGGDSKTLMFVNVSPESSSTGESICSLRFAARVNSCEIGVPRRHTQARPLDSRLSCG